MNAVNNMATVFAPANHYPAHGPRELLDVANQLPAWANTLSTPAPDFAPRWQGALTLLRGLSSGIAAPLYHRLVSDGNVDLAGEFERRWFRLERLLLSSPEYANDADETEWVAMRDTAATGASDLTNWLWEQFYGYPAPSQAQAAQAQAAVSGTALGTGMVASPASGACVTSQLAAAAASCRGLIDDPSAPGTAAGTGARVSPAPDTADAADAADPASLPGEPARPLPPPDSTPSGATPTKADGVGAAPSAPVDTTGWPTVREAARESRRSVGHINKLAVAGILEREGSPGEMRISPNSLRAYMATRKDKYLPAARRRGAAADRSGAASVDRNRSSG